MNSQKLAVILIMLGVCTVSADDILPVGSAPEALSIDYFPDRAHAFIWRNWPIVEASRLAEVLETTPDNVKAMAESMGLPPQEPIAPQDRSRITITIIRRNWHLLPYEQLLTLLDMSAEELALTLREDDFLYVKLGSLKPQCKALNYAEPDEAVKARCSEIKKIVKETFGKELEKPSEPRFEFVRRLSQVNTNPSAPLHSGKKKSRFSPRYIYSYFALYGDPLMNPELDPYPEGLLQKLSELGVDGVWMHTVLRQLAPSSQFPEFGEGHETRLKNLRKFAERAQRYGIGIYLYMNEPRAMRDDFFAKNAARKDMQGVREGEFSAMCTSSPQVRAWIEESLAYVFEQVPGLAGVFTITGSENLTNCASHGRQGDCPHCQSRNPAEIIAEVNATIERGVHRGNPDAKVICWDWGWRDDWAQQAIALLPKSVYLMSVSEWSKAIERGGVPNRVGEYSISVVGPGPRATKHWKTAKENGLLTLAKVQLNNTWELSSIPYLPVLDLVAEHCENLLSTDVNGLQLSWTLGGYPSPNLEVAAAFDQEPVPSRDEALEFIAQRDFGTDGAIEARKAWTAFSEAFREYPYDGGVVYRCPVQVGPANPLYWEPTHYGATMVGIPYDDVKGWCGPYPADVFEKQFSKVANGWKAGLDHLQRAVKSAPPEHTERVQAQLRYARAAYCHFASVANQTRFTQARNEIISKETPPSEERKRELAGIMRAAAESEIELAREEFALCCEDSCIGFEASNHYFYIPVDLMEKAINCRWILEKLQEK